MNAGSVSSPATSPSPAKAQSHSTAPLPWREKLAYNWQLLQMRLAAGHDGAARAQARVEEVRQFVAQFEARTGKQAAQSTLVEIGFGARPERAFVYSGFFAQVYAMDLDAPVLSLRDLPRVLARNGWQRAIKSAVRHILFDRRGLRDFHQSAAQILPGYRPQSVQFIVGDAAAAASWKGLRGAVDLVVSHDVFEHIPPAPLRALMGQIAAQLARDGVVMTQPMIYTGICGGHDPQWYPHNIPTNDPATAWGHLTDPDFATDTYLNKLSRQNFRDLFTQAGFAIVDEAPTHPQLGAQHLTPENRARLAAWSEDELFSNTVAFWLAPPSCQEAAG